jgi:hypothetical protein
VAHLQLIQPIHVSNWLKSFTVTNAVKAMGAKASVDLMAIGCTITVSQNQESIFCEQ